MSSPVRVLLIDNYDSFTHNLLQLFATAGADVRVVRNDVIGPRAAELLRPHALCISPGPGRPSSSGCSAALVSHFAGYIPILGVCLGMQVINEVYGGSTVHAPVPVHGKTAAITHDGSDLFRDLPSPFQAARYHSLCVGLLGDGLRAVAHSADGVCMALRHDALPVFGVQFHPESFLTEGGQHIAERFLDIAAQQRTDAAQESDNR